MEGKAPPTDRKQSPYISTRTSSPSNETGYVFKSKAFAKGSQAARLEQLINELSKRVMGFENRLKEEFVSKDEFLDLFLEATRDYVRTGDDTKHDYLAGLIVTSMTGACSPMERDFFLKKIREFSIVHLDLLRLYYEPVLALESRGIEHHKADGMTFSGVTKLYLPDVPHHVIVAAHTDLYG